ncbi:MAG: efflux RND transporter periplasmic adaptor subunit [Phycisphaerales bacterium]|nr:efflux RND transporter periplasmic adaptor subunit [Phycisphaerales bacterium]
MSRVTRYWTAGATTVIIVVIGFISLDGNNSSRTARAANPTRTRQADNDPRSAIQGDDHIAVVQPAVEDLHRTTTQPAHIEPYERTDIYAKAAGYLSEVLVDIGDRVQKGQVLAKLWIPEMDQERLQKASIVDDARAAVEQAKSGVAAAAAETGAAEAKLAVAKAVIAEHEAECAFRRSEHERIAQLVANRSMNEAVRDEKLNKLRSAESALAVANAAVRLAEAEIKVQRSHELQARANLARAEAQYKVAEANFAQTEVLIGYSQIVAPYDGLITRRWVDSGDFVTSAVNSTGEPLFTVDRDERLRIVFDIPEAQSSLIHIDQPASLVVDALKGRAYEGRVTRTTGVLNPQTRTLRAEVELDSATTGLRPGMYGMITIVLADRPQAMTIPTASLRYEAGSPYVFCAADGVCEKRAVSVGYSDSSRTEIIAGVGANDLVVANPNNSLRSGEAIRVAKSL